MICIVDTGGANLASIQNALHRLDAANNVTVDPDEIYQASHVILPGVGHAQTAMGIIESLSLTDVLQSLTQPVLGICLGMHLLCQTSEEGPQDTLGCVPAPVVRFPVQQNLTVPHMGWNQIHPTKSHPLLAGIDNGTHMYFVHSYYVPDNEDSIASTQYHKQFCSVFAKDHWMGVQFHPEKSGAQGQKVLRNFICL